MLKYRHKLDYYKIRAAEVTPENLEELAGWCGGDILFNAGGKPVSILVSTPIGKTRAIFGEYVYQQGNGFYVLRKSDLQARFEPI